MQWRWDLVFVFKQYTAYDLRISDWSSDVCSSDLAHPDETRDGALNFVELLEQRASRHRLARAREAEAVAQFSDRISTELEKEKLVASYEAEVAKKKKIGRESCMERACQYV